MKKGIFSLLLCGALLLSAIPAGEAREPQPDGGGQIRCTHRIVRREEAVSARVKGSLVDPGDHAYKYYCASERMETPHVYQMSAKGESGTAFFAGEEAHPCFTALYAGGRLYDIFYACPDWNRVERSHPEVPKAGLLMQVYPTEGLTARGALDGGRLLAGR